LRSNWSDDALRQAFTGTSQIPSNLSIHSDFRFA
jgi:hypothetical protein